ncbi:MAG: twin-arginine translocase TatA/TatE family subunit [Endomicrobia bacterium]|nr:twin-arginine translocase TatA/TatE family subunit [Endomicrobiia bacterium]MCL2799548.1 twin-arginine translocase TatA/TatE family subunit [Endomicrobiia bacterium]
MSLGIGEIVVIIIAIVILFGGKKIPELARALGRASYEFKKARESIEKEITAAESEAKKIENAVKAGATTETKESGKSNS